MTDDVGILFKGRLVLPRRAVMIQSFGVNMHEQPREVPRA